MLYGPEQHSFRSSCPSSSFFDRLSKQFDTISCRGSRCFSSKLLASSMKVPYLEGSPLSIIRLAEQNSEQWLRLMEESLRLRSFSTPRPMTMLSDSSRRMRISKILLSLQCSNLAQGGCILSYSQRLYLRPWQMTSLLMAQRQRSHCMGSQWQQMQWAVQKRTVLLLNQFFMHSQWTYFTEPEQLQMLNRGLALLLAVSKQILQDVSWPLTLLQAMLLTILLAMKSDCFMLSIPVSRICVRWYLPQNPLFLSTSWLALLLGLRWEVSSSICLRDFLQFRDRSYLKQSSTLPILIRSPCSISHSLFSETTFHTEALESLSASWRWTSLEKMESALRRKTLLRGSSRREQASSLFFSQWWRQEGQAILWRVRTSLSRVKSNIYFWMFLRLRSIVSSTSHGRY